MEQLDLSDTLLGRQEGTAPSENSSTVSSKVKNTLPMRASNPTHEYLSDRNKHVSTQTLYVNVCSGNIHICPKGNILVTFSC